MQEQAHKTEKVFEETTTVGQSTIGWFYWFKLPIVISDKGEILNFAIIQANVDDRDPLKNEALLKNIFGKLFKDKDYI